MGLPACVFPPTERVSEPAGNDAFSEGVLAEETSAALTRRMREAALKLKTQIAFYSLFSQELSASAVGSGPASLTSCR